MTYFSILLPCQSRIKPSKLLTLSQLIIHKPIQNANNKYIVCLVIAQNNTKPGSKAYAYSTF